MTVKVFQGPTEFDLDKAKVAELQKSTKLEDRVLAILMNEEIGSYGFWESYARDKAKKIVELIDEERHDGLDR